MRTEQIGNATLYLGDCRDVLPTLGAVDAVVTDPPYGIGIAANPIRQAHEKLDWDAAPPDAALIASLLSMSRVQIIWGGNYFGLPESQCFLVWDKKQPEGLTLAMCEMAWTNLKQPAKMYRLSVTSYEKVHPTQKPIPLMVWCLGFLPEDATTVLDPFMGSGTTGMACAGTRHRFIGIEREPSYFDAACRRIEQAQRQGSLFGSEAA